MHVCSLLILLPLKIEYLLFFFFFFSWLLLSHLFLFISCSITFWKPFGISSVMICWLSNGEGPLGDGLGVSITNRLLLAGGGGVDSEIKNWQGGRRRNDGFTKKLPRSRPPSQLINNDRLLKQLLYRLGQYWYSLVDIMSYPIPQ